MDASEHPGEFIEANLKGKSIFGLYLFEILARPGPGPSQAWAGPGWPGPGPGPSRILANPFSDICVFVRPADPFKKMCF